MKNEVLFNHLSFLIICCHFMRKLSENSQKAKNLRPKLTKEQKVQECDATGDDLKTDAGNQKINLNICYDKLKECLNSRGDRFVLLLNNLLKDCGYSKPSW